MSTQHLSVRREDGAYNNRPTKNVSAMEWAVKHETSKHIDTPHV